MAALAGAACSSGENTNTTGKGGAGGKGGSGGTTGLGGSGGTTGLGGSGGTTGTGGGGVDAAVIQCMTGTPATPLILDFSACGAAASCSWGAYSDGSFSGYTFEYGGPTSDFSGLNWHITGSVSTFAGFALGFTCTNDASAYTGVTFTMSGNAGPSGRLTLTALNAPDDDALMDTPGQFGTKHAACHPVTASYDGTCNEPTTPITVTADTTDAGGTVYQIPFTMFTGGKPLASPDKAQLTGLVWVFQTPSADAGAYNVDLTIRSVSFY